MIIEIDTRTGHIHMEQADTAEDAADQLLAAINGLWQWHKQMRGIADEVEEAEAVMLTNPLAELEAWRANMRTWLDECTKYNVPGKWHIWNWFASQYIPAMDYVAHLEHQAGVDITDWPWPDAYGTGWLGN